MKPLISFAKKRFGRKHHLKKFFMGYSFMIVFLFLFAIFLLWKFNAAYTSLITEDKKELLVNKAQESAFYIKNFYLTRVNGLQNLADSFPDSFSTTDSASLEKLYTANSMDLFDHMGIADVNGNAIDSEDRHLNISERDYFIQALSGQIAVSEVIDSMAEPGIQVQIMAAPVRTKDNTIAGIVYGITDKDSISAILNTADNMDAYLQIVDSNGNYITSHKNSNAVMNNKNVWKEMENYTFLKSSRQEIMENIQNNKSGYFEFSVDGDIRLSYYVPLDINNWHLYSTIRQTPILTESRKVQNMVNQMFFWISALLALILVLVLCMQERIRARILFEHDEAIKNEHMLRIAIEYSKTMVFEYKAREDILNMHASLPDSNLHPCRIENALETLGTSGIMKDSSLKDFHQLIQEVKDQGFSRKIMKFHLKNGDFWFRVIAKQTDSAYDTEQRTVGLLEDVTENMIQKQEIQLQNQLQKALFEKARSSAKFQLKKNQILEINQEKLSEFLSFESYKEKYIFPFVSEDYLEIMRHFLHREYLAEELNTANRKIRTEFLFIQDTQLLWTSCEVYKLELNKTQDTYLLLLNDIDTEKRQELELRERAERDGLTGLYNARTAKMKINQLLADKTAPENGLFLILDLDNFKQINDTFGHLYGDRILNDTAQILQKHFRKTDIIARLGGDEFTAYLPGAHNFEHMAPIFDHLVMQLHRTCEENGKKVTISASIGIASVPEHGTCFEQLYFQADHALYQVKETQKNGWKAQP